MSIENIAVAYSDKSDADLAKRTANKWHFTYIGDQAAFNNHSNIEFLLLAEQQKLKLLKLDEPKLGAIYVDFVEGASAHRRKFGGGRGQDIADRKSTRLNSSH